MSALASSLFLRLFAAFALFAFAGDIVADSLSDLRVRSLCFRKFTIGLAIMKRARVRIAHVQSTMGGLSLFPTL